MKKILLVLIIVSLSIVSYFYVTQNNETEQVIVEEQSTEKSDDAVDDLIYDGMEFPSLEALRSYKEMRSYQVKFIETSIDKGLKSSNKDKQLKTLAGTYDYLFQNPNADKSFLTKNPSHMSTLRGFSQSREYELGLLGLATLNLIYKVDDKVQTEYLLSNAMNIIGPEQSQFLVKIFIEREQCHPILVRGFWHDVILRGHSEDIKGPPEAALELSKINTEDRLKYLGDIIKLMETDNYIGSDILLTAISNYGESAHPYLNRLKNIRKRMALKNGDSDGEFNLQGIDNIINEINIY